MTPSCVVWMPLGIPPSLVVLPKPTTGRYYNYRAFFTAEERYPTSDGCLLLVESVGREITRRRLKFSYDAHWRDYSGIVRITG